jgi:hypothetical protein
MEIGRVLNKVLIVLVIILVYSPFVYSQVDSDYDRSVDFSKYKTYDFGPGTVIKDGVTQGSDNLLDQKVNSAVENELNAKGLRRTSDNPDLLITYVAGAHEKTELESAPGYAGPGYYGGWWDYSWNNFWVRTYEEGTLLIDLKDAETNQLVYRVYGVDELKKPEKRQKQIDKIAKKGFKDFPPSH